MHHPTDGTLRRLVDEPAGVVDTDRDHVAGCPPCLAGLAAVRADAVRTGAALGTDVRPDVDAAWRRLSGALAVDGGRQRAAAPGRPRRWRDALRSPVAAAVGVLVIVAGAGAAAAADWLQIFRTERIAAVSVSEADLMRLPDLSAYGRVEAQQPDLRRVADPAAAERATGLAVPRVAALPRGVTGPPEYQVAAKVTMLFTFSAAEAARTAAAAGATLPTPPAGLDGSQFRLVAGPAVAAIWSESRGVPALVAARAAAPTAYSTGVPFATARDYLLSLPGLPQDLAAQLRSFTGDGATLPLPVPTEWATTATVDVGGVPATVVRARDGSAAMVVWVADGIVTAVAGSLSAEDALSVARILR